MHTLHELSIEFVNLPFHFRAKSSKSSWLGASSKCYHDLQAQVMGYNITIKYYW